MVTGKISRVIIGATILSLSCLFSVSAISKTPTNKEVVESSKKEKSFDGLKKVPSKVENRVVYINPHADFSVYKSIQILKAHVAFKKNWQKDFNRENGATLGKVSDKDILEIKAKISKMFDDTFTQNFSENGYPVVNTAVTGTLLIRPALVDLDLANTGTSAPSNARTFSKEDESVTLYIELYDAVTGEILARVAENKSVTDNEYYGWQNRSRNNSDMIRLLTGWATELRHFLDNSHKDIQLKATK